MNLDTIEQHITRAYVSLDAPQRAFVAPAIKRNPYSDLITALTPLFSIGEDTDSNYDVGFLFNLEADSDELGLWLSMVGPYAAILRTLGENQYAIVEPSQPASANERRLLDALQKFGILVLDRETLEKPIPLNLTIVGAEDCRIFQALFTDTDVLPWEDFTPPGQ